jgi:hypothetical protein
MKHPLLCGCIGVLCILITANTQASECSAVLDQEQNEYTLANFASIPDQVCYSGNNVQSFIPSYDNVTSIEVLLGSVYAYGVQYKVGIFDALPNTGAQPIAESSVSVNGPVYSQWAAASFNRVPVTPGNTYYIGFCHAGGQIAYIAGSDSNPYPNGILYGLGGDLTFPNFDITFKTLSNPCEVVDVTIDIKPGSFPNSINLCSNGTVPVAILGSDTFSVSNVNTDTLRFAEAAVKFVGQKDPNTLCSYEDINGDTIDDLVCQYVTTDIAGIDGESSTATVDGNLLDGTPIQGTDSVNIVKDTCN